MPETVIELDRVVPTAETALPFFWVWSDDVTAFVEHAQTESVLSRHSESSPITSRPVSTL